MIDDPASTFQIQGAVFNGAPLTFRGESLTILRNSQFSDSPLTFQGRVLDIEDSGFDGKQGIIQDNGTSTLKNVDITNYTQFGYKLTMGRADITGGWFAHDPSVQASPTGASPPWALRVEAAGDSDSALTTTGTFFDGSETVACNPIGPESLGAIYSITDTLQIHIK
jgi:hypothetical protein